MPDARVGHADLDLIAGPGGRDRDAAAWLRRLNRVRDQVAIDAAEREPIALDHERARRRSWPSTVTPCRSPSARIESTISATDAFTSSGKRSIGFGLTMLRRSSMKRFSVASSRSIVRWNIRARLGVEIVAQQQPRAVADVLDRMGEVVDQAGGDAAEHRLALLALDVLLELDEPVGHGVEGVPELAELVAGRGCRRACRAGRRRRPASPRCSAKIGAMNRRPKSIADADHDEQGQRDRRRSSCRCSSVALA